MKTTLNLCFESLFGGHLTVICQELVTIKLNIKLYIFAGCLISGKQQEKPNVGGTRMHPNAEILRIDMVGSECKFGLPRRYFHGRMAL